MARGDPEPRAAFEELLSQHLDTLYRTALRLVGGHEADAEDLLQQAALHGHACALADVYAGRDGLPEQRLHHPPACESGMHTMVSLSAGLGRGERCRRAPQGAPSGERAGRSACA